MYFVLAHSNAGDTRPDQSTIGAGKGYAGLTSVSFSQLAREEWRTVSTGLTILCTQAEAISNPDNLSTVSYHAAAFAPLVQTVLAGLVAGPARSGELAAEAAVIAASTPTNIAVFSDERFTDVAGESGRRSLTIFFLSSLPTSKCFTLIPSFFSITASFVLIFAMSKMPNLCPSVLDPRAHFAKSLEALSKRFPGKVVFFQDFFQLAFNVYK